MARLRKHKSSKPPKAVVGDSGKSRFYLSRRNQLIGIISFAIIGAIAIVVSHAATPFASLTASSGTVAGNASIVTDSTASNGSYVKFNAPSTGGAINCPLVDSTAAINCWDAASGIRGADSGKTEAQIETDATAGTDPVIKYVLNQQGILTINANGTVSWSGGSNPLPSAATTRTVNGVVQHGLFNTWVHNACVVNLYDGGQYNDDLITLDTNVWVNGNCASDGSCAPSPLALGCANNSSQAHANFAVASYVTVDGNNQTEDSAGITSGGYTCDHCTSTGFMHNWWAGGYVTIKDSYGGEVSTYYNAAAGAGNQLHRETIDADSAVHSTFNHNYLRIDPACPNNCGQVTAAFMNGGSWAPPQDITVTNNFLEGGAGADMQEGCGSTDVVIQNNAFSSSNGFGGNDFIYGFNPSDAGNIFTGNYIPEQNNAPLASNNSC